jgi:hypothetical protein
VSRITRHRTSHHRTIALHHRLVIHRLRCRIEPYLDQAASLRAAAGPALAPISAAFGRPARRTPGHTRRLHRSARFTATQTRACVAIFLASIVQLTATASNAPYGRRCAIGSADLGPGGPSRGPGAYEEDGEE